MSSALTTVNSSPLAKVIVAVLSSLITMFATTHSAATPLIAIHSSPSALTSNTPSITRYLRGSHWQGSDGSQVHSVGAKTVISEPSESSIVWLPSSSVVTLTTTTWPSMRAFKLSTSDWSFCSNAATRSVKAARSC